MTDSHGEKKKEVLSVFNCFPSDLLARGNDMLLLHFCSLLVLNCLTGSTHRRRRRRPAVPNAPRALSEYRLLVS